MLFVAVDVVLVVGDAAGIVFVNLSLLIAVVVLVVDGAAGLLW